MTKLVSQPTHELRDRLVSSLCWSADYSNNLSNLIAAMQSLNKDIISEKVITWQPQIDNLIE